MLFNSSSFSLKKRILIVFTVMFLSTSILLVGRLFFIQIVTGEQLRIDATEQQTRDSFITSRRGAILDRNGKQLAVSATVETVSIAPNAVRKEEKVDEYSAKLAEILEMDVQIIKDKIMKKTSYEIVKRKIPKDKADTIRSLKLKGVYLDEDSKRYYPYGNFASHLIGFTGDDNQGLLGIEMVMDSKLKGKPGRVVTAKNADGTEMPYKYERYYNPEDGTDVVLTIDQTIQYFLEKHLETAVSDYQLRNGAYGIVMNVKTGEILGISSKPDFDLNSPFSINNPALKSEIEQLQGDAKKQQQNLALQKMWRNKAVVDSYEPGSTFKILVSAMALEQGVLDVNNDHFFCSGSVKVGPHTIHCFKRAGHGPETFVEGLRNSCNPVFMAVGERIGKDAFYKYFNAFGMSSRTGIELPGETSGVFHQYSKFNQVELATCSFGQSFQITPLQIITAVSAIANGGNLLRPHLVKQYLDSSGNVIQSNEPQVIRRVVSADTSKTLCGLLESVVSEGTGKGAFLKGYRIAGKTGTSEKLPRNSGKYIASFIGFAPANDPKIAVLIVLDEPADSSITGGMVAAPIVGKIFEDTLRYMGIEPELSPEEMAVGETVIPNVIGAKTADAKKTLEICKLRYRIEGSGDTVTEQIPKANVRLSENATVILYTGDAKPSQAVSVPNLVGMSIESANVELSKVKLNIKTATIPKDAKNTKITLQDIKPGQMVQPGSAITVEYEPVGMYNQ